MIWNPHKKEEIDKIERIHRNFTSKIKGLEQMDYHERLKKLGLYSLERKRERFLIINAWQQLEEVREDVSGMYNSYIPIALLAPGGFRARPSEVWIALEIARSHCPHIQSW